MKNASFGLFALALLSGCGGSAATNYQSFDSTVDATNAIGGHVLQSSNTVPLNIRSQSGTYAHASGATTVSDGTYSLSDPNGLDGSGVLTDGASIAQLSGNLDFVRSISQTYTTGGISYDVQGVIGLQTTASDMPSSDSATYNGSASAIVTTNTVGFDLNNGSSVVTANFANGRVNVTLDTFETTSQTTGLTATGPFDEIRITDMAISGNTFNLGDVTLLRDGSEVDVLGSGRQTETSGGFFGITPDGVQPDEVGGVFLLEGNDAEVVGIFTAD